MNTLTNKYDTLEQLIYTEGIKIQAIDVHVDMDMLLIILNTGSVLKEKLSKYFSLKNISSQELMDYELTGNGTGIHWPKLDEDLSLKGFLRDSIKTQIMGDKVA
ncbi:MAG: DUF2442 domain-containing protein [Bacteroidota bacterium]